MHSRIGLGSLSLVHHTLTEIFTSYARLCMYIKGTVARDFPSKVPTLDPDSYPKFFFRIYFQIRGVIRIKV
jgi:hypothetical protein